MRYDEGAMRAHGHAHCSINYCSFSPPTRHATRMAMAHMGTHARLYLLPQLQPETDWIWRAVSTTVDCTVQCYEPRRRRAPGSRDQGRVETRMRTPRYCIHGVCGVECGMCAVGPVRGGAGGDSWSWCCHLAPATCQGASAQHQRGPGTGVA